MRVHGKMLCLFGTISNSPGPDARLNRVLRATIHIPLGNAEYGRNYMTLCPIAIAVGCKKCPAFTVCPLKGVVGDYKKPEGADPKQQADGAKRDP